ncbi:unnamed protein product [Gemmata massiliana]|uniref:Uncharacterized protein n=1 Tax=Gemmata massiliana TaxID=1210884 RepID=A0A6P2D9E3_9BACT|nr:hypothetical protein [Gemmata massiliana]VTR97971.1 unnamed protein product [Gemmata massiliana]
MTRCNKTKRQSRDHLIIAEHQLRLHAAEWVGSIRTLIKALTAEVEAAHDAAKEGTLLARVLDPTTLNDVYIALDEADTAALNLNTIGYELPVPNLLAASARLSANLPQLVTTGAKGGAL